MSRGVAEVQPTLEQPAPPASVPRAADRFVDGSKSPGPGPDLPAAPPEGLGPSIRAILARLPASKTRRLAVVQSSRARLSGLERSASSSAPRCVKPPLPVNFTPRTDQRAELRHPCAPRAPSHAQRLKWLRLLAHNWLCLVDRYQKALVFCFATNGPAARGTLAECPRRLKPLLRIVLQFSAERLAGSRMHGYHNDGLICPDGLKSPFIHP